MDPPPLSAQTARCRIAETSVYKSHDCHVIPDQPGAKLRLMCSHGGHILPRPHDKSLCYVGGDTRIVVVNRHSSLKQLCLRLSRTLLHGRPFALKYLLPNEDLDNLISITIDEDLQLMIQEYDRITAASPLKPSRLRLFLFLCEPETWFVDAINDSRILSRIVSDSAAVDCLVNLHGAPLTDSSNNLGPLVLAHNYKRIKNLADVHSAPDSPAVDNTSSSGSSSSSPSMASLPPIGVDDSGSRLKQEQRPGIEELFAQLNFAATEMMKQHNGYGISPAALAPAVMATSNNMNGVNSDAQASEITPFPLQLVHPKTSNALCLLSPDPVASESSIASTHYLSKPVYFQDQVQGDHANMRSETSDPYPEIQRDQVQDCGYGLPTQLDHSHQLEQFVHFMQLSAAAGQVAMPSYCPVHAPPTQHPIGQHYPVYVVSVGPTQPTGVPLGRPLIPQSAAASVAYKNATPSVYGAPLSSNSAFLQSQFQRHYVGFPQFHCLPQSNVAFVPSATASTSYGCEYGGTGTPQRQTTTPLPPHYQSMTPPISSDASKDN